ncbi:restriction endonuclease subunit S [Streptomyces sp. Li-HN-5-11]|uniref:restriction endonuclease subunit S n=1 Tax=Streptomyces sp. Li-HN-5-11 TaxID=3075432 RepID=UPI0028B10DF8|nr:restriction endonuclease subunit S [Streptomyces sp. Li-HN-5-11]WNM30248.1 restriction endonuclease subunit S [Streptomyces sp. Li-HN-5-11]
MSRIDDLIREFCPSGVESKPIGEIGELVRGNGLPKSDFRESGVGAIHYGQIYTYYGTWTTSTISFVAPETAAKLAKVDPSDIIITNTSENLADVGKAVAWLGENQIVTGGHATVLKHDQDPKYIAYWLQSPGFQIQKKKHATGTKVIDVSAKSLAKIKIPIPPIEVQREIVRVLDSFSALEAELEAKLEAELEARRVQHSYYWNALLTPGTSWRRTTLGQIAEVFDGPHATPRKTATGPWYLSISSLENGRFNLASSAHIGEDQYETWVRRVAPRLGDTMFSYETRLGQAAYWDRDEPAALGRRMGLLRPNESEVDPRFLTLVYLGPEFQSLIRTKTVSGATVDRIPIANMASWPISIPSIPEQRRIVSVLDNFDAVVNDLSSGLPAELNARRTQYEYYRDKLLTFEEAAV